MYYSMFIIINQHQIIRLRENFENITLESCSTKLEHFKKKPKTFDSYAVAYEFEKLGNFNYDGFIIINTLIKISKLTAMYTVGDVRGRFRVFETVVFESCSAKLQTLEIPFKK